MANCLTSVDFKRLDSGALDEAARTGMEEHLSGCDTCRTSYARFRSGRSSPDQTQSMVSGPSPSVTPGGDETIASDAATIASGLTSPPGADATMSMDGDATVASSSGSKVSRQFPRIEGYKITSVLGQGGMGTVYRAVQAKLSRIVALKVLHAVTATANPDAVLRFRREATAAARLHHTNIIPVYDFGESADGYFYAMELISGQPLNSLVKRFREQNAVSANAARLVELLQSNVIDELSGAENVAPPSASVSSRTDLSGFGIDSTGTGHARTYFREVARWMADAADALHYAHQQDIIHRDIKPANLILSTDGRVMIADFGLAKTAGEQSVTMTGTLVGTLRYMSPEQAMAKRVKVDHRTDIYSLGATMYELLCFQPAYPGEEHNEILSAIIARDPTPPNKVNSTTPAELSTICLKSLEKLPDARYADAKAMADDLRRWLSDLPIVAKRPGPLRRIGKFVRRHKAPVAAVAAAVLLAVSVPVVLKERAARRKADVARLTESAGTYAEKLDNFVAAKAEIEKALAIDPDNVKSLMTKAWLELEYFKRYPDLAGAGALQDVDHLCGRVVQLDPDNGLAWYYRGTARKRLGEYAGAIEAYSAALKQFGNSEEFRSQKFASLSNLGAVYLAKHELDKARHYLTTSAELVGQAKNDYAAAAWRNLAAFELFLQKPQALEHISYALSANKFDGLSRVLRARMRLELKDHIDPDAALTAAKAADEATEEPQDLPYEKRILALAHLRNGHLDQAIEHAGRAIELDDMATVNYLIMAVAEARRGDLAAGREYVDLAAQRWPGDLKTPRTYRVTLGSGDFWIDTADELIRLRDEARSLLAGGGS